MWVSHLTDFCSHITSSVCGFADRDLGKIKVVRFTIILETEKQHSHLLTKTNTWDIQEFKCSSIHFFLDSTISSLCIHSTQIQFCPETKHPCSLYSPKVPDKLKTAPPPRTCSRVFLYNFTFQAMVLKTDMKKESRFLQNKSLASKWWHEWEIINSTWGKMFKM